MDQTTNHRENAIDRHPSDDGSAPDIGARIFTDRGIGVLLALGTAIALVASFQLGLDKIRLLEDSAYNPACNFSILTSCKSVMNSAQGSAFGPTPSSG